MLTLAAVLNLEGAAPDHRRVYAVAGRFMLHSAMSSDWLFSFTVYIASPFFG